MGVCLSCLGLNQGHDNSDPSESERLLYVDPQHPQYGGVTRGPAFAPPQPDPEGLERERDALERLCAATSEHLIDISHLAPAEAETAAPKMPYNYARLYAREFCRAREDQRSSASTASERDEDEDTWLDKILNEDSRDLLDSVVPIKGGLVITLEKAFGPNASSLSRKSAQ